MFSVAFVIKNSIRGNKVCSYEHREHRWSNQLHMGDIDRKMLLIDCVI